MDINTSNKFNFENITLDKPTKIDDLYISNLNVIVQTCKLTILKINNNKLVLSISEKMEKLLNSFDETIISLISENSEDFFEDKLSIEDTEELYKNSYKNHKKETKMTINMSDKLNIFNKHKEILTVDSLSSGDNIICLLKCSKIVYYKAHCIPYWEVIQIKIKEEPVVLNTNCYLFVEDKDDTYIEKDKSLESSLKMLKIKS